MRADLCVRLGRRGSAVAVLALGLLLVACGGGSSGDDMEASDSASAPEANAASASQGSASSASAPQGSASSASSASSPTAGQNCRLVTWLESRPMPMSCGEYICFTYVAVPHTSTVCN